MTGPLNIRLASPEEAGFLSGLALRSKGHWGYSQCFLDSCRAELTVDPDRIGTANYQCFVAANGNTVVGFYILENVSDVVYELAALFVEPKYIGRGVGQSLIQHAVSLVSEKNAERLIIQSDPNATHFFLAMGAQQIGTRESGSISGRFLPVFQIEIENH